MKRKLILINYFITAVFLVFSCTQKETKNKVVTTEERKMNQPEYPIQLKLPEKGDDTLKASLFARSIKYIPLETTKETFLRGIWEIRMNDSIIAIADSKRLLLFDYNGKFLRRIGKTGNGPGEFLYIFNFELLEDTLYISSSGKYSIIKYTLDGTFQEEQKTKFQPVKFRVSPNGKFILYSRDDGTVNALNNNFQIIESEIIEYNVSKERLKYSQYDPVYLTYFYKGKDRLLFTNYLNDTIWNVSAGRKTPEVILSPQSILLPWTKQIEYSNGDFEKFEKQSEPYQMINVMETPSYLFLFQKGWQEQKLNSIYIHDLKTNQTHKFETAYIFDDMVARQNLSPMYFTEDYIISTISPMKLLEDLKNANVDKNVNAEWLEKMRNIKEDDNPVLVLVKPKKLGE
jgi:hypothetical protein